MQYALALESDASAADSHQSSGSGAGVVKWFDAKKGYGFIVLDLKGMPDVFIHLSVCKKAGYANGLSEGQRVYVTYGPGRQAGKIQANSIDMP